MSFDQLLTKVFGSSNQRYLKSIQPIVDEINALEPQIQKLSDEQLRARTAEFKEQLQQTVEGVTDLAERDHAEPRRQVERRCERRVQACFGRHAAPDWHFQIGITIT